MVSERVERVKSGESKQHQELKGLSLEWLKAQGCRARATEVRLPLSPYRVDVAGYRNSGRMGALGETFVLECKQSRADFLRDASVEKAVAHEQAGLAEDVERLRELLGMHLPECRQWVSLFSEYDEYDFGELRHERWRRLVSRLSLLERKLADGVKFSRIARYGASNFCYLVVDEGVLKRFDEIPLGWGCLVREEECLRLERVAKRLVSADAAKLAFLERVAARR
ncbi:hypothetical protein [Pelagicoccus sp. SDUM812002]|uniref:hypothetical protein n=1 Tax=Pelagicoccus sp. SDUM812002 TaxID=3041266 RepID=UPI00280FAFD1|nr:hypothetical protein [Pelagicoccus sp. SDUM812002]MDQ8187038.1 hypothetical protein [Pelagicoccus sp. SDUM812002]